MEFSEGLHNGAVMNSPFRMSSGPVRASVALLSLLVRPKQSLDGFAIILAGGRHGNLLNHFDAARPGTGVQIVQPQRGQIHGSRMSLHNSHDEVFPASANG